MKQLTREQAAIIGAFTGILCGPFEDVHGVIERVLDRPVFTHEMTDRDLWAEVKKLIEPEYLAICATKEQA
jgi:hypothetical protein